MPTILSYNIHCLAGPNAFASFIGSAFKKNFKFMDRVVELIDEVKAQLVGLNEMPLYGRVAPVKGNSGADCLDLLKERLNPQVWQADYKAILNNSHGVYGNALMADGKGARWMDGSDLLEGTYSTLSDKFLDQYLGKIMRNYLIRCVKFDNMDKPLIVALTHLEDFPTKNPVQARWAQAAELVDILNKVREKFDGAPALIMGDMNAAPPCYFGPPEPTGMVSRMQRNENPAGNPEGRNTIKIFSDGGYKSVFKDGSYPPTYPASNPALPIDHILVSDGIRVNNAWVVDTLHSRSISDHLPVVADIEW